MYTITIKPKKSENANSIQSLRNDRNEIMYTEGELKDGLKRLDNELSKQKTRIEEMKKESTIDTPELNRLIRGQENFLDAMEATKKELKEDLKALTQEQNKKAKRKQFKDSNEKPKKVLKESNITPMKKAAMAVRELKKFKEEVFEDGEWYLSTKKVEHYLTIQWKLLKPNEALKGLCDMLEMCPYQQDFLKSKILEKIGKMDLNAADEDAVKGSLVPELETIWLMADTTLPRTWREMMTLKTKIKKIDRYRKSFDL